MNEATPSEDEVKLFLASPIDNIVVNELTLRAIGLHDDDHFFRSVQVGYVKVMFFKFLNKPSTSAAPHIKCSTTTICQGSKI